MLLCTVCCSYVGNLDPGCTEELLVTLFSQLGSCKGCKIIHEVFLTKHGFDLTVFTARCYASAVLAMGLCLCLCVCLSQVGVLLKGLNVGSQKQRHTIAQELEFSYANAGGVGKNWRLSTNNQLYLENGKR